MADPLTPNDLRAQILVKKAEAYDCLAAAQAGQLHTQTWQAKANAVNDEIQQLLKQLQELDT